MSCVFVYTHDTHMISSLQSRLASKGILAPVEPVQSTVERIMATSSSNALQIISLTTHDDGSIAILNGPQALEISTKSLDILCTEESSEVAQVTPTLTPAAAAAEKKEPVPVLSGWRRAVHAAAQDMMKDFVERAESAEVYNNLDDYPIYHKLAALTDALRTDPNLDKDSAEDTLNLARMVLYLCDLED